MSTATAEDLVRETEVNKYGIVGKPPLPALQRLVDLAAALCGAHAAINIITATEQVHVVASKGDAGGRVPKEASLCNTVMGLEGRTYLAEDLTADPLLSQSPFVTGEIDNLRFYAAATLTSHDEGVPIGALCVFDEQTREWSETELELLATLGQAAGEVLETHRRDLEVQALLGRIQEHGRELVRSNTSLVGFAGQVSHDLQGPLASVKMALEMYADVPAGDEATRTFLLERALSGTERMQRTIVDMMDFATIGGGQLPAVVDLDATLDTVLADLDAHVGKARIEATALPRVLANEAEVRSVLQNLVSNALKFSGHLDEPHVLISGVRNGDMVRVSVADNGPGVAEQDRDRIFQMMTRGDTDVEGHGIGLSTCARIVASRGGSIGLEETESGGALFWFELPAA